jgi:hypothetical protein
VRGDALALLLEHERAGTLAPHLRDVLVVALEVERVAGDEREEDAVAVEPPAAEHAAHADGPETAQGLDDELDEFAGFRHGHRCPKMASGECAARG